MNRKTAIPKLDLRKELKHLYAPSASQVEIVEVPAFNFLMLDGAIQPGETVDTSPAFQEAFQALYGIAYTLKFTSKQRAENPIDYTMPAMEGLWWVEDGEFEITRMGNWRWTLMMLQPEHISEEMFQQAVQELARKKDLPSLERLRFEPFHEGLCMQIMHIGPYAEEMRTVEVMKAFAEQNGYVARGKHHEIYLGDPRRAKPENLRTILRHPIRLI